MAQRVPGHAVIKQEFLLPIQKFDKKEVVNKEELKAEDKIEDEKKLPNKNIETKQQENGEENLEPPKKKKLKGQNKARPRTVPKVDRSCRLCPTILREEECSFGEKCAFSHDVQKYLSNKPPDISEFCVHFELTGKCKYGVECRYGKKHLDENFKNIINQEKYDKYLANKKKDNHLSKELMIQLRKKQYKFPKTDIFLKNLKKTKEGGTNLASVEPNYETTENLKTIGTLTDEDVIAPRLNEKKTIDFSDKLYLAPLTTVGNLPFRRICKRYGADITCGEMAMSTQLLQGSPSEWALVKRHSSEDIFGVQLCGGYPDTMTRTVELLSNEFDVDFIDINLGCPIDLVFKKGEGSALMGRMNKLQSIVKGMVEVSSVPITLKMRTGIQEDKSTAHKLITAAKDWGVSLMTLHGRSREQRYTRAANWDYIDQCAQASHPVPFFGNGDILSYEDANLRRETTGVNGLMIARGALMKPWLFTEIKEQRHWDISSSERMEMLKDFANYGLEHWGSDTKGVENTRRFLLEWLSFLHRYIPVGLLEVVPQKINEKPPPFIGRDDLETLFASRFSEDWVKISEMLLGPVPDNFQFIPKHKANSYSS